MLTGSEKAFAAGADIKEMQAQGFADMYGHDFFAGWDRFAATRKPIIAAVAGYALGGGCELAMMCDFILAADTAKFGQPEIKLGVSPGMGGSQRLTRAVGKAKAMEMCLTGRMMDAAEAERAGLVSRVVPAADLVEEAVKTADGDRRHGAARGDGEQGNGQRRVRDGAGARASSSSAGCSTACSARADQKEGMAALRRESSARQLDRGTSGSMARVAFIGLGNMGGGMAANLAKAGHDVRAFDLSAEALDAREAGRLPARRQRRRGVDGRRGGGHDAARRQACRGRLYAERVRQRAGVGAS